MRKIKAIAAGTTTRRVFGQPLLMLGPAGPFQRDAAGKPRSILDRALRLGNELNQVAIADVEVFT